MRYFYTVTDIVSREVKAGNDVTTVFNTIFTFDAQGDLVVSRVVAGVTTLQVLGTNYTVSGGSGSTGSVTTVGFTLATGESLIIERSTPQTQAVDIETGGTFDAATLEAALDKMQRQIQEHSDDIGQTVRVPDTETTLGRLPAVADRANTVFGFDASGDPFASDQTVIAAAVANWAAPDFFNGDGATVAFVLAADPVSENNLFVTIFGVEQDTSTFSVSGTTLTFVTAPPTGTNNVMVRFATPLNIGTPADNTVSTVKIQPNAVDGTKIAMGSDVKGDLLAYDGADYTRLAVGTNTFLLTADSAQSSGLNYVSPFPKGHLHGCNMSIGTDVDHDIDILAGEAASDDASAPMVLAAITKQIDAGWAVGTDAGGLDTDTVAASTWYAVWMIKRPDTGVVDILFSLSFSAPTMPTNYTKKRYIGACKTNSSSNWFKFTQDGDSFWWETPKLELDTTASATAASTTLTVSPKGKMVARLFVKMNGSAGAALFFYSPDVGDIAADDATGVASFYHNGGDSGNSTMEVQTDASQQIRWVGDAAAAGDAVVVSTLGWIDTRGRLN